MMIILLKYRNILRHELELKSMEETVTNTISTFLNNNIYQEGNISRIPDFGVVFFLF